MHCVVRGPIGPPGLRGADGLPGYGLPGLPGQPGLPGEPGTPGADNFEVGTIGPAGLTGPTGADGPPGAPGETGETGPTGPSGADGAHGPDGPDGTPGAPGSPGTPGNPGTVGNPGTAGPDGPQGLTGDGGNPLAYYSLESNEMTFPPTGALGVRVPFVEIFSNDSQMMLQTGALVITSPGTSAYLIAISFQHRYDKLPATGTEASLAFNNLGFNEGLGRINDVPLAATDRWTTTNLVVISQVIPPGAVLELSVSNHAVGSTVYLRNFSLNFDRLS